MGAYIRGEWEEGITGCLFCFQVYGAIIVYNWLCGLIREELIS